MCLLVCILFFMVFGSWPITQNFINVIFFIQYFEIWNNNSLIKIFGTKERHSFGLVCRIQSDLFGLKPDLFKLKFEKTYVLKRIKKDKKIFPDEARIYSSWPFELKCEFGLILDLTDELKSVFGFIRIGSTNGNLLGLISNSFRLSPIKNDWKESFKFIRIEFGVHA